MKTKLKQLIDNFIIKHKIWFLKYWDNFIMAFGLNFLIATFISPFTDFPFIMCGILIFDLLLLYFSMHIGEYIENITLNYIERI